MSDIKPLSYADPMTEVLAILKEDYPALDTSKFTIERVVKLADGQDRNTELTLLGVPLMGFAGTVKVKYDRLMASQLFNKFGDVTKQPALRINAMVGTSLSVSTYLAHINALLGTNLTISGNFPDIADRTFNAPDKGTKITVVISPYVSSTGYVPVSLRLEPTDSISIDVVNAGAVFSTAVVNRGLNPFVSGGNLIWRLEPMSAITPGISANLALFNADFSAAFGTTAKIKQALGAWIGTNEKYTALYRLSAETRNLVNPVLEKLGLPVFTETSGAIGIGYNPSNQDDRRFMLSSSTVSTGPGYNSARTLAYTKNFWGLGSGNYIYQAGRRSTPPAAVNPEFEAVAKLYPPGKSTDIIRDMDAAYDNRFWYLHYNSIV